MFYQSTFPPSRVIRITANQGALPRHRIAASRPLPGRPDHPGPYRVQHHVAGELQQIAALVHQHRRVAPLQHTPDLPTTCRLKAWVYTPLTARMPRDSVGRRVSTSRRQRLPIRHPAYNRPPVRGWPGKPRSSSARKIAARALPRAVTWYSAPSNSSRSGRAMAACYAGILFKPRPDPVLYVL